MFKNRSTVKLSTLFITLFLIALIRDSTNARRSEAFVDPSTLGAVYSTLKFTYRLMCTHSGLEFDCKGQAKKALIRASDWLHDYAPKAVKYTKNKLNNIAKYNKNKDKGFFKKSFSIVIGSPSIITNAIYGIDLDDAQEEMILPEYYTLVKSIRRNSRKLRNNQSKIHKYEVKLLRTNSDDNVVLMGRELDIPIKMGADDIEEKLGRLSDKINSLRKEIAQKYSQLSEFLSSHYGIEIKTDELKRLIGRADGESILETVVMFRAAKMITTKLEAESKQHPDNPEIAEQHLNTVVLMQDIVVSRLKVFGKKYEKRWIKKLKKIKSRLNEQIKRDRKFARDKHNKSRTVYLKLIKENMALANLADSYAGILKQQSKAIQDTIRTLEDSVRANLAQLRSKKLAREYHALVRQSTAEYNLIQKLNQPKIFIYRSKKDQNRIDKLTYDIM